MKNNFLSVIIAGLVTLSFSACQKDVDVMGGCDKITTNSILGEHSLNFTEGLNFTVEEYKFAEGGKGVFVQRSFGDGIKTVGKTYEFTYSYEDYGEHNVGRTILVDAGDNGVLALLWKDGFISDEQERTYEASALEENFEKIIKALPNTDWMYKDIALWIDTTTLDSLHIYTKNVKDTVFDPVTGEPLVNSKGKDSIVIVEKEFIDTVYYDVYDTVGSKMTLDIKLVLKKDANNVNTGTYLYDYKEFNHDLSLAKDSVVERDFHWGFSSVTSAKKFVVMAIDDAKKDTVNFEISKFDKNKKVLTLDGREFKLQ